MSGMTLSVFLSYSHKDRKLAQALAAALDGEGIKVWVDEGELRTGDSFRERITAAIEDIDFVIALVSSNSVNSDWCKYELKQAMTGETPIAGVRVLPVRVGDVTMPPALKERTYLKINRADPAESARRLASDMRRHSTEKPDRLVAALAGSKPRQGAEILRGMIDEKLPMVVYAIGNLDLDWSANVLAHLADWNLPDVAEILVQLEEVESDALLAKIEDLNETAHYVLVRMVASKKRAMEAAMDASLSIFENPEKTDDPEKTEDPDASPS
jgi:hypothetical protein